VSAVSLRRAPPHASHRTYSRKRERKTRTCILYVRVSSHLNHARTPGNLPRFQLPSPSMTARRCFSASARHGTYTGTPSRSQNFASSPRSHDVLLPDHGLIAFFSSESSGFGMTLPHSTE